MTALFAGSYAALWVLMLVVCALLVGVLRELGALQERRDPQQAATSEGQPPLEEDGPLIGSGIPRLAAEPLNGLPLPEIRGVGDRWRTLLVLLSPMCQSCQRVVDPLNALVEDEGLRFRSVVILRADEEGCSAFLRVFPLRAPVICDADRSITMGLGVHRNPFGLLYDERGLLIRKGVVTSHDELLALLGDPTASATARAHMFPSEVQIGPASELSHA